MSNKLKVLVVGANGMVGTAVSKKLLNALGKIEIMYTLYI